MNNLTTNQKKQILSQLITNKVKENKSIIEFIGISLDSINYAQIVANMLINNSILSLAKGVNIYDDYMLISEDEDFEPASPYIEDIINY